MELVCDVIEGYTDEEGREYCWRVRLFEGCGRPAVVVAMPFLDPGAPALALMLEANPCGASLLLEQMELSDRCWWFEQAPGDLAQWSVAYLDAAAIGNLAQPRPGSLPRRQRVLKSTVERSIAPHALDKQWTP